MCLTWSAFDIAVGLAAWIVQIRENLAMGSKRVIRSSAASTLIWAVWRSVVSLCTRSSKIPRCAAGIAAASLVSSVMWTSRSRARPRERVTSPIALTRRPYSEHPYSGLNSCNVDRSRRDATRRSRIASGSSTDRTRSTAATNRSSFSTIVLPAQARNSASAVAVELSMVRSRSSLMMPSCYGSIRVMCSPSAPRSRIPLMAMTE